MKIYCLSDNPKKQQQYHALQQKFAPHMFEFVPKSIPISEIQSVDGYEVIVDKMKQARSQTTLPFIVDDVSLLVGKSLYPGALIKHLLKNVDARSLSQFLPNNVEVEVVCRIGYFNGFDEFIFMGEVCGTTQYDNDTMRSDLTLDTLICINNLPLGELAIKESARGRAFAQLISHIQQTQMVADQHNKQVAERWNARAEDWESTRTDATSYVNHEQGYERFDAELKRILPLVFGAALDIGCGDGDVTRLISSNPAITSILGMDISSDMIRVATDKTSDDRIQHRVGTFLKTDVKYDLITTRGVVLSHMSRSQVIPTLTTVAESLSPGGYLVFDYISNLTNHDDARRMSKTEFKKDWLLALMMELGLVNVSYNGSNSQRVSILVFHKPTPRSLYFASSNPTKILELQSKCKNHTLHLANVDVPEIKHEDIVEIAKDKAKKSYDLLKRPVIVTDGGIFINALHGFPGANSKQAALLLGPQKMLALLAHEKDKTAVRRNCMVFYDGQNYRVCLAEVPLIISDVVTDSEYPAYPLDKILIPLDHNPKKLTYKQMPVTERVKFTELPFFEEFIATL